MYTTFATSSREQTGNIITFAQFEEGNISTKTRNNAESGDESDDDSIMPPLLIKEEMDSMGSGDESEHDLIYKEMLENIRHRSQTHPTAQRKSHYIIRDCTRQRQLARK